jgi:hypothetical protein
VLKIVVPRIKQITATFADKLWVASLVFFVGAFTGAAPGVVALAFTGAEGAVALEVGAEGAVPLEAVGAVTGISGSVGAATGASTGVSIPVGASTGVSIPTGASTGVSIPAGASTGVSIPTGASTGAPTGASTGVICPWIHGTRNDARVSGRNKDSFIFDDVTRLVELQYFLLMTKL